MVEVRAGVLGAALLGVVLAALPAAGPARAADAPAKAPVPPTEGPKSADDWQFQLTVYGWLSALDGAVGVRRLPDIPVNASFGDLLSKLEGVLPVSFLAKKDGWTLLFDYYGVALSADSMSGPPLFASSDVSLRQTIASAVFGYRLPVGGPDFDLSATAGFRYQRLAMSATLVSPAGPFAFSQSDTKDWLDPVFGLMLQYRINDKWFLNALADIGGFGLGSQLTSQGFLAVGYNWTEAWSTAVGYRALYTDYESVTGPFSDFRYRTTIHGPFVSAAYHF